MTFLSESFLKQAKEIYRPLMSASKSWACQEALRIVKRCEKNPPPDGMVVFSTGYGPSGLPHIGTFGEVLRTTMIRQAFAMMSDYKTKLICFSDDMDGLRKIPDNVPNPEILKPHLGKPLTAVPNPFTTGKYSQADSFGAQNNERLKDFLNQFDFDYEFISATAYYQAGKFDEWLTKYLQHHDAILKIMLPTLGEERQATYSPFLPIDEASGQVLQVPVTHINLDKKTITYEHDGKKIEQSVLGGKCKLQWKPDWSMRMQALHVDYEMSGKDLIPSAELAVDIINAMGGRPPEIFHYELFLDEQGQKISKSKGNGLSLEQWLKYAPKESASYFMYQKPKTAKRLFFDIIPKNVDEFYQQLRAMKKLSAEKNHGAILDNPIFHIAPETWQTITPPQVPFSLLLHLVSASGADDKKTLWGFIQNYHPEANPDNDPTLDNLVGLAIDYYHDIIKPNKKYKIPSEEEKKWLTDLKTALKNHDADKNGNDPEIWQGIFYEVGKTTGLELKLWFGFLYQTLLGQTEGPRLGSFIALLGRDRFLSLVDSACQNQAKS